MKGPPYPEPVRPWIHTRAGGAIALLLSALVAGCIGTETDNTSVPITRTSNKAPIVPGYESMRVANGADAAALGEVLLGARVALPGAAAEVLGLPLNTERVSSALLRGSILV